MSVKSPFQTSWHPGSRWSLTKGRGPGPRSQASPALLPLDPLLPWFLEWSPWQQQLAGMKEEAGGPGV